MILQRSTQLERRRWVYDAEERTSQADPLFEGEWDVFVVKRDPETGAFVTETLAAEEADEIA